MIYSKNSRAKNINVFTALLLVTSMSAMAACYLDNTVFRIVSYSTEALLIFYTLIHSHNIRTSGINIAATFGVGCILVLNYLISPNNPNYTDLLKFLGYFCCFLYGTTLARRYESLSAKKVLLYSLVFIPILVVALFDHTVLKNLFFTNSNTFVYTGLSMGLFYALMNYKKKHFLIIAWLIVAFYVLVCTSLGVVVAILLSYVILNLKVSHLPYLLLAGIICVLAVFYIEIPLFIRLRDVINLWMSMSLSDWKGLQYINFYELNSSVDVIGERSDVGSSIWRISHWASIFTEYVRKIWTIPFGLGVGFSISYTGLLPHNDYLLILSEYGLLVFILFVKFFVRIYKTMKAEGMLIYIILSMMLYHFTENLILTFPPNALFYFILGWCSIKIANRNGFVSIDISKNI